MTDRSIEEAILLKLLDAEIARSNNHEDVEDRKEALAQIAEGGDLVLDRVREGIRKYVDLLDPERNAPMRSLNVGENPEPSRDRAFFNALEEHFRLRYPIQYLNPEFIRNLSARTTASGHIEVTISLDGSLAAMEHIGGSSPGSILYRI